jgi:putative oxidoreductase
MKNALQFPSYHGWAIAIIRIVTGVVFAAHGLQKFVNGLGGFESGLERMGIPAPEFFAPLVASVELFGGMALLVGLFTRWVTIPLAINMIVAAAAVHLKNGFFLPTGFEYVFVLFASLVGLFLAGSGELAMDNYWLRRPRHLFATR